MSAELLEKILKKISALEKRLDQVTKPGCVWASYKRVYEVSILDDKYKLQDARERGLIKWRKTHERKIEYDLNSISEVLKKQQISA